MARGTIIKRKKRTGGHTFDIKYRTRDGRQIKKAIGPSRRGAEQALTTAWRRVDRDDPLELPYERPTMRFLDREEARAYLAASPGWYRPLAETLIGAGLRIGEAVALEWSDIDWDAPALLVSKTAKVGGVGTPKG